MKVDLEHIAVASNSEEESDKFFLKLLGMEKARSFKVAAWLTDKIFGINKEMQAIRYESDYISVEVFVTEKAGASQDIFTHNCLLVDDPDELVTRANKTGFHIKKIPRKGKGFYYFINDSYKNLYEIKKIQ
ncbi:MAG: VOC family protein [Promethearchaeia archaeon]